LLRCISPHSFRDHSEFAELATNTIVPLALAAWDPQKASAHLSELNTQWLRTVAGTMTVLPLHSPEFLKGLTNEQLDAMTTRWEALWPKAPDDTTRLAIDLFLDLRMRSSNARLIAKPSPPESKRTPPGRNGIERECRN
jgi:hypothetical protein